MPSSRGYHPTRASMMCGLATPGPQVPPPQAGYSPGTAGEAPRARELSSPCHPWLVGEPRPGGPKGVGGHGSLKHQAPAVLGIHAVYWTAPPPKGCDPAGTTLAGPDGRHASLTPRDKTGKSGGFACGSPFLIPLPLSVCPSFYPSITVCHFPSLAPGWGEGGPKSQLQPQVLSSLICLGMR